MLRKINLILVFVILISVIGCSGETLNLISLQFASSVTKFGNFIRIEDATFSQNQTIYVVAVAEGFISEKTKKGYSAWPILTLKLRNAEGKLLNTQQPFSEIIDSEEEVTDFRLPAEVKLKTPPGDYVIEVTVEDGVTGERVESELHFEIKPEE